VVGGHVCLVQIALFVVHPGEGTAVGVVHEGTGLPVDPVRTILEQRVAEVDEGEFGKAEHRGYPPVGVVHPGGGPAQFVVELKQRSPVLRIEPDPQGSPPPRQSPGFV